MTDSYGLVEGLVRGVSSILEKQASVLIKKKKYVHVNYVIYKPNGDALRQIGSLVDRGIIKPDIACTFELRQLAEAHEFFERGKANGKVVITVPHHPQTPS